MPKYKVNVKDIAGGGSYRIVEALHGGFACKVVEADPSVKKVITCEEIRENEGNHSDGSGSGVWLGIIAILVAIVWAAPWSTMVIGGALGTYIMEFICGTSTEDAVNDNKTPVVIAILILAISFGGFGFMAGHKLKTEFMNQNKQEQIKK